ncbi:MAG: M20 family metallopeptidase [bacterium]|nr:M20 family metallopeptidase [bacterium]
MSLVELEKKVLGCVDEGYVENLLKKLISIRTVFPPPDKSAMLEMRDYLVQEMKKHGLRVRVVGDEGDTWVRPNVIGELGASDGPGLILAAHTDIVPEYDLKLWRTPPFEATVRNGILYGRGAADTKGSLAAMMGGVFAVASAGIPVQVPVSLVAWAGDEYPFLEGAKYFNGLSYLGMNRELSGQWAILGEPYDLRITYLSRGRIWLKFEVRGEATHSAAGKGINAIRKASDLIDELYQLELGTHPVLGRDSINVGVIKGGDRPTMVPDWCAFTFDIRFASPLTVQRVREMAEEKTQKLQRQDPEFVLHSLEIPEKREPIEFPRDSRLNLALKRAGLAIESPLSFGGALSFGDIADWKDGVGIREACLFGPGETKQAHAVNEHVALADVFTAAKAYALTILYLCVPEAQA